MAGNKTRDDGGRIEQHDGPDRAGRLLYVAHLDGALNGQVIANRQMLSLLQARARVIRLPLGATPWRKILAALRLTAVALWSSSRDRVYLSLPGQRGGWLLLAALLLFRFMGAQIFLHHHSYRGMKGGASVLGRALACVSGPRTVHILLSEAMAAAFAVRYLAPGSGPPLTVSNAALWPAPAAPSRKEGPVTVGFLGAWTAEKGIFHMISLADRLLQSDPSLHIAIAGAPRGADSAATELTAAAARWPGRFTVHGWLEGADKAAFLARLDCLLLPSRLADEAEPLSMIEAYSAGAEVLATALGAIPERISARDCLLTLDLDDDVARISRVIADRRSHRDHATFACHQHALHLHHTGLPARDLLLARLTAAPKPATSAEYAPIAWSMTP
jgi:glycosyltransferase involved in cell wall biosynthesis